MVFAWKEGSFPGSAYRYLFSTSSHEPGKVYDADSMFLDRYLGWSPEWSPDGEWVLTIKENFMQISIINTSSGKERVALEIPRELLNSQKTKSEGKVLMQ